MREDAAKKMVCPMTRAGDGTGLCVGGRCMAWRWIEDAEFKKMADAAFSKTGKRINPDTGFCAMVGR